MCWCWCVQAKYPFGLVALIVWNAHTPVHLNILKSYKISCIRINWLKNRRRKKTINKEYRKINWLLTHYRRWCHTASPKFSCPVRINALFSNKNVMCILEYDEVKCHQTLHAFPVKLFRNILLLFPNFSWVIFGKLFEFVISAQS